MALRITGSRELADASRVDFEHRLVDYLDVNPESRTRLPPAVKTPAARSFDARLLIAAAPGGPAEADDRGSFARTSFAEIGGIRGCPHHQGVPFRTSMSGIGGFCQRNILYQRPPGPHPLSRVP